MNNKNVDLIISQIHSCLPNNRNKFNKIMNNLKEKLIDDEKYSIYFQAPKVLSLNEYFEKNNFKFYQYENINAQINYKLNSNFKNNNNLEFEKHNSKSNLDYQNINFQNHQSNVNNKNYKNKGNFNYITTLPEGELINKKTFYSKNIHQKIYDVYANSKYYYPLEMNFTVDFNREREMEWNNRTNNIIYNTMNNNWNEDNLKFCEYINKMRSINHNIKK